MVVFSAESTWRGEKVIDNPGKQEAVVRAIQDYVDRRAQLRDELLKRIVDEDAALLDLLAK